MSVDSGVPQGTVLGPLLFLLYINDLPQSVRLSVRLFADDCLIYKTISSLDDTITFQRDLDSLHEWGLRWGMSFNVTKCNIMRLAWSRQPITKFYTLGGEIIQEVNQAKYLGVMITSELGWSTHYQYNFQQSQFHPWLSKMEFEVLPQRSQGNCIYVSRSI